MLLSHRWEETLPEDVDAMYSVVDFPASTAPARTYDLYLDSNHILQTDEEALLLDRLASGIHHQVALKAPDSLFVHAGVVGWRDRAIVLPGRSHAGKSTLVAELVRAGALYYSDEYAVFDQAGFVHPYPKPLSLRQAKGPRHFRTAEILGGRTGTLPLPLGVVALLQYLPGAAWLPKSLTPAQSVLALLDNTILARSRPDFALKRLGPAVSGAIAIAGSRGEARDAALKLLEMVPIAVSSLEDLSRGNT